MRAGLAALALLLAVFIVGGIASKLVYTTTHAVENIANKSGVNLDREMNRLGHMWLSAYLTIVTLVGLVSVVAIFTALKDMLHHPPTF